MKINLSTLEFLRELSANNHRDWFQANKGRYESAFENMKQVVGVVKAGLEETDHIEKANLFRIYRDVRFSKDKSPYKDYFGVGFSRATKQLRGGYYLHVQPGESFVGGGFWEPNAPDLKRIRDEFAFDDKPIRAIMSDPVPTTSMSSVTRRVRGTCPAKIPWYAGQWCHDQSSMTYKPPGRRRGNSVSRLDSVWA